MDGKLSPAEYEDLVHELVARLGVATGESALRKGRTNLIPGASGFEHQIDVSIHLPRKLVLMECKYIRRPVEVHHALVLAARLADVRQAHPDHVVSGSLVSTKSVRVGAYKIAKHFGFSVDLVQSLDEYAVTIANTHHLGEVIRAHLVDACEGEIVKKAGS
jgi:hypothetical protein